MGSFLSSYPSVESWKMAIEELLRSCLDWLVRSMRPLIVNTIPHHPPSAMLPPPPPPPPQTPQTPPPPPPPPPPPTPEELIEKAREEYGINSQDHGVHIAVVGGSGVGKSSFVNGIRLLKDMDEGAAPVAEWNEANPSVQRYAHPLLHRVVLWDFPAAESDTFFHDFNLCAFDYILILSSDRFLKRDFHIAKEAQHTFKKPLAFVRTKADVAIKNIAERNGMSAVAASTLLRKSVETSFEEGLKYVGLTFTSKVPLFIVSNKAFTDMNTYHLLHPAAGKMDETLEEMDEHKVYAFVAGTVKPKLAPSKTFRASSLAPPQRTAPATGEESSTQA